MGTMTMTLDSDAKTRGRPADVARTLGISKVAVGRLIKNRARTGFPLPGDDNRYDLQAVARWYVHDFNPRRGPRRGIRAETK